jgi:integrase
MSDQHSSKAEPAKSTGTVKKPKPKVKKNFPLTWHPAGQWCKRVNGKLFYFGKDSDKALQRWLAERDDLTAGRKPRDRKRGSYSLEEAVNLHLLHVREQVERGEKSPRWFEDMKSNAVMVLEALGRHWAVDALSPEDFAVLRKRLTERRRVAKKASGSPKAKPQQASHTTVTNRVIRCRTMFNWFVKAGVLDRAPEYGTAFDPPNNIARENERLERGSKDFTRQQVRALLKHSKDRPELHAAILLALNTGCQNVDIETLKRCHIDLEGGWYIQPRAKRAKPRRAKLWPRTVRALRAVIGDRELTDGDSIFVGKSGGTWHGRNCLAKEFAAIKKLAGITKTRCGFQWLRHTFITQASQGGDLVAVQLAVGHADRSITLRYIHNVFDPRLVAISAMVDAWLVGNEPRK